MKKQNQLDSATLRQKAEELLSKNLGKSIADLTEAETQKLLHELQVHQIELELQNEELILARRQAIIASEKYIELYDFAPLGYYTLSRNGKIIQLNLMGAKMLGNDRSQLKNRLFHYFISDDSKPIFRLSLEKAFSSNTLKTCEVTLSVNGSAPRYVHLTCILAEKGDQCLVTATDITQRIQAESELRASNEFNQLLLKTIPLGMNIVDESGNILYFSKGFQQHFGAATLGKKCWELYRDDQKQCSGCPLHAGIDVGMTETYEIHGVLGGKIFEVSHTGMIYNGQKAMLEIFIDITERKQVEQELIIAKELAEESDRLKSAFLANMSHEIRTPMNGILGFAELLKEPDLTGEEQQEYIRIIEKSGARMLNIINDIIDISKIEAGLMKINFKDTDINEKIEFLYTFFKPEVDAKGINLSFKNTLPAKEAILKTDREKLYAILTNLIKNAIKYTKNGSIEFGYDRTVETGHALSLQQKSFLQFYVKDTGIGIRKDRQIAIFERFVQADIVDKHAYQGAGLGLSISKAYIEMLGGKIWVESEEGIGSTFYFTLPYNTEPEGKNRTENSVSTDVAEYPVKNLKILIVEDDESSSRLISIDVQKFGKEIICVQTGTEAVEACHKHSDIDLVLMDIQLPEMDGYEATRQIRQFNKDVIIIAQTAYAISGDKEKTLIAGCNDYISKPINRVQLMELIHKYF